MAKRGTMRYVPPNVLGELDNIKKTNGIKKDSHAFGKMVEFSRVGREFETMRNKFFLRDVKLFSKKKKRGSIQDVGLAMIFIFVAAIMFFVSTYGYQTYVDKAINTTAINSSNVTVTVMQESRELTERFDYVIFMLLIGFSLGIIITGWLVGGHPLFTIVYFLVLVVLVAVSAILSFVWNKVSTQAIFGNLVNDTFPITDFILANFPTYIAIIGFIGMFALFAKASSEANR